MITYTGIEWDYNNLEGIGYNSETLLEPYKTWLYLITGALNVEQETINLGLSDGSESASIYNQKDKTLKFKDYYSNLVGRREVDSTLTISDNDLSKVNRKSEDDFSITDSQTNVVKRRTQEGKMYFLDETRYKYKLDDAEDWTTVEQIDYSGATSLFDFEANTDVWSESDFADWCENNCPVNYNPVRPFLPGEYEYTDAYVGFKLTISPSNGRFGVANNTVYIDVEDTVEKGTSQASAGSLTEVTFSKRFYTTPHIMTSLLYSGENCYIVVDDVSRDGFKFGLKSASSGQYIAGEIDWLADGY